MGPMLTAFNLLSFLVRVTTSDKVADFQELSCTISCLSKQEKLVGQKNASINVTNESNDFY